MWAICGIVAVAIMMTGIILIDEALVWTSIILAIDAIVILILTTILEEKNENKK